MPRLSGQVFPQIPPTAPLELRLPAEVYALDGTGNCTCPIGPTAVGAAPYVMPYPGGRLEVGPKGHLFETLGEAPYVMPYPGGRLEVGPKGHLFETLGAAGSGGIARTLVFVGGVAILAFMLLKKKR